MLRAHAAPLSTGSQALVIDSSQSRHERPDAASCANRFDARWWQWSGRSLLASHLVYWPETMATYWPSELDVVKECSLVTQAPCGLTVPVRNGAWRGVIWA